MLVSVIVPFYNVAAYLRRCLHSIIEQSYKDLEIILVDDCSSDASLVIAKEYAQKDKRIVLIEHQMNKHQGGARNSALMRAKGEYLWFIDSDDAISSPYAVEHLVSVAQRDDADVVLFNAQLIVADGEVEKPWHFYTSVEERIFNEYHSYAWAFYKAVADNVYTYTSLSPTACFGLYRRNFFFQYNFQFLEHTFYEDIPLLVLTPLAQKITQIPQIYYNYHLREGSTMRDCTRTNHLEHFERIATQLWQIYDSYWFDHQKVIVPIILMYYPLANVKRTFDHVHPSDKEKHLAGLYDFLRMQLYSRIKWQDFNPWPMLLENQEQWKILFSSFEQVMQDGEKSQIIHGLLYPRENSVWAVEQKKQGVLHFTKYIGKKIIKMALPYGLVRWIQRKKRK